MRRSLLSPLVVAALVAGCGGNGGDNPPPVVGKSLTVVAGGNASGSADGPIATATFNNPVNVAVDADGTVYVCDFDNNRVRKIAGGVVSTLVDQPNFERPFGITIGADGTLYVQTDANDQGARDSTTGTIWRVDKNSGVATVVARNLGRPRGILAIPDGRIVMADLVRCVISTLNPTTGVVTPVAGEDGVPGYADGMGTQARFDRPYGMTRLPDGTILVADQNNNRIRRVNLNGEVLTFAGGPTAGSTNGHISVATFNGPQDVDRAPDGRIFIADTRGHTVRMISNLQVSTFAGDGTAGFADGLGTNARLFGLEGMAIAPNGRTLYVADGSGGEDEPFHRVRFFGL